MQESQQFRQNFLLLFMKLKWFLKRWRQGKMVHNEGEDFLEVMWAEDLPFRLPWMGTPCCWAPLGLSLMPTCPTYSCLGILAMGLPHDPSRDVSCR